MNQKPTPLKNPVVLVTVSGQDNPGITASITEVLSAGGATILDIGQAVIHGWLSLSILFKMSEEQQDEKTTIKDLLFRATELGLKLEFQIIDLEKSKQSNLIQKSKYQYAITLIADCISAKAVHWITNHLSTYSLNIDEIQRLSEKEFSCIEIITSSEKNIDIQSLKKDLLTSTQKLGVDMAIQNEGIFRKSKRLVVFDMDSTLIQNEVIDEMARYKGCFEEVSQITEASMKGELDYNESLIKRVSLLDGLTLNDLKTITKSLTITPGASDLIKVLKKLGYKIALISGGFSHMTNEFKKILDIDYAYANELEFKDGKTTGKVFPPLVNAQRKADLLELIAQQEKISLGQVIAIGDGANDLLMLEKAGLGIAFNAKPVLRNKADLSLNQKNLKVIFYLLGISAKDIEEVLD
jgi:phosphoserine phosphatase